MKAGARLVRALCRRILRVLTRQHRVPAIPALETSLLSPKGLEEHRRWVRVASEEELRGPTFSDQLRLEQRAERRARAFRGRDRGYSVNRRERWRDP